MTAALGVIGEGGVVGAAFMAELIFGLAWNDAQFFSSISNEVEVYRFALGAAQLREFR